MTAVQPHMVDAHGAAASELAGKRLLILGGGLWQVEYVRRSRQLGLETWVTDWSPSAVARCEADHFEPIDLKDRDATLALAERAKVDGVFTAADIGVPTAAHVAARLGLPGASPELAALATNKFAMRERCMALGIACPRYCLVRSVADGCAAVRAESLPVIVKPVDSCSSRGVRWVDRPSSLAQALEDALAASLSGQALVEQFLVGTEGSIEAIVQDGQATVLGICDKTKSPLPDRYDLELRYPGTYAAPVQRGLEALAQRIATGFNVRDGILHIEFIVLRDTGDVLLIEFAIRGCGSKVVTHLMPPLTGVDVVGVLLRQALGLRSPVSPRPVVHGALHFLMFPHGRVAAVHGVAEALAVPGVIDVCVERQPGEHIHAVHDGRSRPGYVLVRGRDRDEVKRVLRAVRRCIRLDYDDASGVAPLELPA